LKRDFRDLRVNHHAFAIFLKPLLCLRGAQAKQGFQENRKGMDALGAFNCRCRG